ncbi:MAG TPA: protein kinase [Rectinemataceae bacterium]|nr:protein kinase [Rectinemataceae bacterium]
MQARTVINECYIVRERLGEDCFCELWRATSVFNATEFLLRFFKPFPGLEDRTSGLRETILASQGVSHQAVVDIVDFEQFEGRYFIASAYLGQKSLRTLLKGGQSFGLEELCRYLLELAQGLDVFHSLGLVYSCFNAENALFLVRQGEVESVQVQKPGYFALINLLQESDPEDFVESWAYVAPEVKKGSGDFDRQADVYSLGIHLFRFLTGSLPFPEDPTFVRNEPASLRHVAKALFRRGVPEALIRIAIRSLRPEPSMRYPDCVRFVAELRAFTEERRALWVKKNGFDPLANIETLNRAGGRIGASQIMRSLETADYFRQLSEAPVRKATPQTIRAFPYSRFPDPGSVRSLELREAGAKDKGDLPEDAYIEEALKIVGLEPWAVKEEFTGLGKVAEAEAFRNSKPIRSEPEEPLLPPWADAAGQARSAEPQKPPMVLRKLMPTDLAPDLESASVKAASVSEAKVAEPLVLVEPETVAQSIEPTGFVIKAPRPRNRPEPTASTDVAWKSDRLPQGTLVGILEESVARAKHGRGTFSYVEEPYGIAAAALGRVISRFRDESIVVDMKAFPVGADATDFLRLFRLPASSVLSAAEPRTLRLLGRRLRSTGGEALLAASPLGSTLYGHDLPEPDPDFIATHEGAKLIAASIVGFGRRTSPLVLFCRAGESVAPSAHGIMTELAALAPFAPFVGIIFFRREAKVPAWHSLSKLGL